MALLSNQSQFTTKQHNALRRQVITAHVGQAGCQIGSAFWELLAFEHGIDCDGTLIPDKEHHNLLTMFSEVIDMSSAQEYYFPRSVFLDLEPSVMNGIMTSKWKRFYEPSRMINTYHDSAGNIARSRGSAGSELINKACYALRHVLEECDFPTSSIVIRSATGGCGGGITPEICEYLSSHLRATIVNEIVPSQYHSSTCVEPYNYILATSYIIPHCDALIKYDNHHLYRMLDVMAGVDLEPTLTNLNQLAVHPMACLTSIRFNVAGLPCVGSELATNLCAFPTLKHITPGVAPIDEKTSLLHNVKFSPQYLMRIVLSDANSFVDVDVEGKIIAGAFTFRGDFDFNDVYTAIHDATTASTKDRFVKWNTASVKLSLLTNKMEFPSHWIPPSEPRVVYKFSNETGIRTHYMDWLDKFCQLLNRGAFHGAYLKEGLELSEFQDAFETVKSVCADYQAAVEGDVLDGDRADDE